MFKLNPNKPDQVKLSPELVSKLGKINLNTEYFIVDEWSLIGRKTLYMID